MKKRIIAILTNPWTIGIVTGAIASVIAGIILVHISGQSNNSPKPSHSPNIDNSIYGFEEIGTIWKPGLKNYETAVKHVEISPEVRWKGNSSLAFDVHLKYPPANSDTAGAVYVSLLRDPRFSEHILNGVNLENKRITCAVYVPDHFPIDKREEEHQHVMRLFLIDMNKSNVYGQPRNIATEEAWMVLEVFASPLPQEAQKGVHRDPNFDPRSVTQLGVKISVGTLV